MDNHGEPIQLSEDAKPEDARYRSGIQHRGGTVIHNGVMRVNGDLAVARSIGDHRLKGAISARPKITVKSLSEIKPGSQLILACDGIYDIASTRQIAHAAYANRNLTPGHLARNLVFSSYESGSTDNLSALVVRFPLN